MKLAGSRCRAVDTLPPAAPRCAGRKRADAKSVVDVPEMHVERSCSTIAVSSDGDFTKEL